MVSLKYYWGISRATIVFFQTPLSISRQRPFTRGVQEEVTERWHKSNFQRTEEHNQSQPLPNIRHPESQQSSENLILGVWVRGGRRGRVGAGVGGNKIGV